MSSCVTHVDSLAYQRQSPRSRYIFNTLINDLSMESAKLDVSSAYTIIENMVANFKYNVVKDGELVIQE